MILNSKTFFIIAGCLSLIASMLHVAIIFGGEKWYRFFGAGEAMARMAAHDNPYPAIITSFIAIILMIWAAYGFAAAGLIPKLPFMKFCLIGISAIYSLRGAFIFVLPFMPQHQSTFNFWSSFICLLYGVIYAMGLGLSNQASSDINH